MSPWESAAILAVPLLWLGVFHAFSLYSLQHLSAPEEFRRVIGATSVGIVLPVMSATGSTRRSHAAGSA
jgi:hypothetical protein